MRPVASERFAQSQDAWILLGALPERPECRDTADGGPATADAARRRLARMLLADPEDVSHNEAVAMAGRCADRQARMVAGALGRVAAALGWLPQEVVLSGHGGCLTRRALDRVAWQPEVTSLPAILGDAVSRAGPAHAVAAIARGAVP
jgi:uncharacterized hydantoinase/oxoprolinase family protein